MLTPQEKKQLRQIIQANKHEVYVISFEHMETMVKSVPDSMPPEILKLWEAIRARVGEAANYYGSVDDIMTLRKLVNDLGGFTAKAYIKIYGGKPHIILKGYPGLRRILNAPKYGIKNPKVIMMGLGKAGAAHAAKMGGILSVFLLTAYRVADYFLTDPATLNQLIGRLATDVVKVGITTGASIAAAAGISAMFTLAIGPLVAVILTGIVLNVVLEKLDAHYGITDRVIAGLDELGESFYAYLKKRRLALQRIGEQAFNFVIDYAIDSAKRLTVKMAQHYLRKFTSPLPERY